MSLKQPHIAFALVTLMHIAAWFLPVHKPGELFGVLRGWQAFLMAISFIWDRSLFTDIGSIFVFISGLTNIWFLISIVVVLVRPNKSHPIVFWGLVLCSMINSVWIAESNLYLGYFLWLASFVLLAAAAFWFSQKQPKSAVPTKPVTVPTSQSSSESGHGTRSEKYLD